MYYWIPYVSVCLVVSCVLVIFGEQRQMSVLQKVKVNDVDIPEGVTKYDLYKVRDTCHTRHVRL